MYLCNMFLCSEFWCSVRIWVDIIPSNSHQDLRNHRTGLLVLTRTAGPNRVCDNTVLMKDQNKNTHTHTHTHTHTDSICGGDEGGENQATVCVCVCVCTCVCMRPGFMGVPPLKCRTEGKRSRNEVRPNIGGSSSSTLTSFQLLFVSFSY